jgi:hypothetical protein
MVQFFGNSQTGLGRLGQALSGGLAEGAQYGVNRGRLQEAFAPLLQDSRFSELAKIAPALLTAPGGSQALSEIAPILLKSALNRTTAQVPTKNNLNISQDQNRSQNQPTYSNIDQFNQFRTQNRSPLNAQQIAQSAAQGALLPLQSSKNAGALNVNPNVSTEFTKRYSPQEILDAQEASELRGDTPEQTKQIVKKMQDVNEALEKEDILREKNYQQNISREQDIKNREEDITNFLNEKLSFKNEKGQIVAPNDDDLQLAYGVFNEIWKPGEDKIRAWSKAKPVITNLKKEKQNFVNALPKTDPIFGMRKRQIDNLKGSAKKIISDNPFMRNVLLDTMLKEGANIYDADAVLSKTQPKINNILKNVQDFRPLVYGTPQAFGMGGQFGGSTGVLNQVFKMQSEGTEKIFNELKDSITPETSLINIYKDLKVKAWMPEFIQDIFNKLSESGSLTTEQEQEKTLLLQDPKILPKHLGFFE